MNILVGIDFSECSELALSQAIKLVAQTGARLHLGYIAYSGPFIIDTSLGLNNSDDFPDAEKAHASLQQLKDQLGASWRDAVRFRL
jgi:nucleotide-binding universal stress UspA family protein